MVWPLMYPLPALALNFAWSLMVSISLPMMTLLLALSAGQSLLRLARVLVGRSKTIRCSLCPQCLQRLSSYVCTPMWHHKALSPSYWCIAGFVDTLLIALCCGTQPRSPKEVVSGASLSAAHSPMGAAILTDQGLRSCRLMVALS